MKITGKLITILLLLGTLSAGAQASVLFSANYDSTFDAQVSTGRLAPFVNDVGANPITLSGGGIVTPNSQDSLFYNLGQGAQINPNWAPVYGKVTVRYTLPTTISSAASMHMIGFYYTYPDINAPGYATYSYSRIFLNTDPTLGVYVNVRGENLFTGGSSNNSGVGWVPNTLLTAGPHTLEWTWERFTPGANTENNVHMIIKVDGNTLIDAYDQCFGWTSVALDGLMVGGYRWAGYANDSIGAFGGRIDSVTIENIAPVVCGDPFTQYPVGDISGPNGVKDCRVNFYDFAAMALNWLGCTDPADPVHCVN